ncbi:MAG: putative sterol methyltransferase [Bryobacterales bacterium]|nr:putative sterol methyltransferase [Bryobacterales bacterium]
MNESGIRNVQALARWSGLASRVEFACLRAEERMPSEDGSFDTVISNDAMRHIPDRLGTLREWHRVLWPNGRMLSTNAMIVTSTLRAELPPIPLHA